MKKQVKIIGGVAAVAVIATAGFFALGAGKKKAPEKKISLSEKAKTLTEGESFTLKVKNGSEKMDAKSKNPSIAALEKVAKTKADYKVTAVKAGETEIVFKKDSKTYSCKVTVNAKPAEAQPQQNAQAQAGTNAQQSSSQSAPSSSASAKNGSSSAKSPSSGNASSSSQRSSVQKRQSTPNKTASSSSGSARKSANSAQSGNKGSSNKSTSTGNKGGTVEVERQWTAKNGAYGGTLTDDQAHKLLGDDYDDFMKHPIVDND